MAFGGVAFNLQVAQIAILLYWRWNPASERLAMDRIHRANSNAFVYLDAGFDDAFVAARQMLKLRRGSHAHKSDKKLHIRRSTTSDTMNLLATGGPAFVCCVGPVFLCRVRTAFLRSLLTFLCSVRSRRISHTCATLKERVPLRLSMLGYDCRSGESSASSSKDVELCAKGDQPGSHPMTCNSVCCLASSKDCQQMSLMSPYSV